MVLSSSIYFAKNNSEVYSTGEEIYKRAQELNILKDKLPALLGGKELLKFGLKPSPKSSEILDKAYEAQMHGSFKTYDEALLWLKNYLKL